MIDTSRSWLFVPAHRAALLPKALACDADRVIVDLEDSVPAAARAEARRTIEAGFTALTDEQRQRVFVRVNPADSMDVKEDLDLLRALTLPRLVLPKATPDAVQQVCDQAGFEPQILAIATETPAAVFRLGDYAAVADRLVGLTWGAEDLLTAVGGRQNRGPAGGYTSPYQVVRALALFGAAAAGVPAIDTVFTQLQNDAALTRDCQLAQRDGFIGKLAIHPAQIAAIHQAFTPSPDDLAWARRVLAAFAEHPDAGVLTLDGQMLDAPHRQLAKRVVQRASGRPTVDQAPDS